MIKIYSKPNCVQCTMTKNYLEKAGVSYESIDITQDPDIYQMIVDMGYSSVPIVISGETSFAGFQPDKLDLLIIDKKGAII